MFVFFFRPGQFNKLRVVLIALAGVFLLIYMVDAITGHSVFSQSLFNSPATTPTGPLGSAPKTNTAIGAGYPKVCYHQQNSDDLSKASALFERDCPQAQGDRQTFYNLAVDSAQHGWDQTNGEAFPWCSTLHMLTCPIPTDITTNPDYTSFPYDYGPGHWTVPDYGGGS